VSGKLVGQCFDYIKGENKDKGSKCAKVKVLFQGLHMTHVITMLVYNIKWYFGYLV
jgi:hypothetical protein